MSLKRLVILLIVAFFITSSITSIVYSYFYIVESRTIDIYLTVTKENRIGLNTDSDALRFGIISRGSQGKRYLDISHKKDYPLKLNIRIYGDLADWISISDNNFVLNKNETKRITFTANVPSNAIPGNYTGRAVFLFKRH
jgi:hypothetical protein